MYKRSTARIIDVSEDLLDVKIKLPINWKNKSYVNSIFGDEYFNKMKILKLNSQNEVQWECVDGDKEWIGTNLSFELEEKEGITFLKFSHLNWAEESEFFGFCSYHWG